MTPLVINLIFDIGLTFGVGASTFALVFYIAALRDGEIDPSERRFMGIVYTVLRVGMALIFIGLMSWLFVGGFAKTQVLQLVLLGVITINAVLMTYKLMPMKYGPILAGGSWYFLFVVTAFSFSSTAYWMAGLYYLLFLAIFYAVFHYCKRTFTPSAR